MKKAYKKFGGGKLPSTHVNDPRAILDGQLLNVGVNAHDAFMIALEAGSSQILVDKEYLEEEYNFDKEILENVVVLVEKFYTGF